MMIALIIVLSLIWGSFLNMMAYRLISGDSLLISRSFCPHCRQVIAWYDLIPVLSYVSLRGKCRSCQDFISPLYPVIELLAAGAGVLIWTDSLMHTFPTPYYAAARAICYFFLFSGLIIATRTDLQAMVIPRLVITCLIPIGILGAALSVLSISLPMSIMGGILGYVSLWSLSKAFRLATGKDGIGEGDMELLGVLGIYFGPIGIWAILLTSSCIGSISALVYLVGTGQGRNTRIPFGPFLSMAAFVYLYGQHWFARFLMG